MKAVVYTRFGPPEVLRVAEIARPVPKDNEILIRVHATTVNYGDLTARNFANIPPRDFHMPLPLWLPARIAFGLRKPSKPILGSELAGQVAAVGKAVTRFKAGDEVYAYHGMNMGAYAEYLCMPAASTVALKPVNMSYEAAAAVPYGGIMALNLLRKVNILPGHKVLINGASGSIGSLALQLARYYGAEVTAVCSSRRIAFVQALGADKVIDYTQEDFTRNGEQYHLIFDVLGKSSFARCKDSLTPDGRYLLASFKMQQLLQMAATARSRKRVICGLASEKPEDLVVLKQLAEAGNIKTVIDRCFKLEEAAAAHRYVENGTKQGSVVISVA